LEIIHIYHSGFLIKFDNDTLVFDCLDSSASKYFSQHGKNYVFTTHSHSDHYSQNIFEWERKNYNVEYFFGDDITIRDIRPNYHIMDKYQSLKTNNLEIETFGSTDSGVSFFVKFRGNNIFHAGDLNWWHWKNDSKETQRKEESDFKLEVDKLKGRGIDIAFIPVDPRLDEYYYLAAEYFAKTIKPKILIPMHFADNFDITKKIKEKLGDFNMEVIEIVKRDQELDINI
jgi:L-ascorbate metabolism protein UlaG (beta-lactamase superfamily)